MAKMELDDSLGPGPRPSWWIRSRRRWALSLAVIAAAILLPLLWVMGSATAGPDDGTVVDLQQYGGGPVRDGLEIANVHGEGSPLLPGDIVVGVGGVPLTAGEQTTPARQVGDTVIYLVRRGGVVRPIPVRLQTFRPVDALQRNFVFYLMPAVLFLVAALVYAWRPRHRPAQLMLAVAALLTAGTGSDPLGLRVIDLAGGRGVSFYVVSEIANCLMWSSLLYFALIFPEPPNRLARRPYLIWALYAVPFLLYAGGVVLVGLSAATPLARLLNLIAVSSLMAYVAPILLIVFVVMAYRRTTSEDGRRRLQYMAVSLVLAASIYLLLGELPNAVVGYPLLDWGVLQLSFIFCPIAIALAIMRHQLFDIQIILRRSLVLSCVVLVLLGLYGLSLLALDVLLPQAGKQVYFVVGGTLAVVLFPLGAMLRRRLTKLILGARDDPYRVATQIGRLDAAADDTSDSLRQAAEMLARTLRMSYVAIDLNSAGLPIAVSTGTARADPLQVPLGKDGRSGTLMLEVSPGREPFGRRDRLVLDEVAHQVARIADLVSLNRALEESRRQLLVAREEERRRLRRDLHDGIGPTLAAQSMRLDVTRELLHDIPDDARLTLDDLQQGTRDVIAELRRIVDNLRPNAVDQLGLVSAIRQRAAAFAARNPAGTNAVQITVNAPGSLPSLPAVVEVAAYSIAIEAINNAVRHGQPRHCQVTMSLASGRMVLVVADDGVGIGTHPSTGVGLTSMRDRAVELGGSFHIAPDRTGRGTRVEATLPLAMEPALETR